jgi:hypothetical protein
MTPITITIDGKEWPITLDTNDLVEVEEVTGLNILMGIGNMSLPSFAVLRALLYVALKKTGATDPDGKPYTLKACGEAIDIGNSVDLRDAFLAAWGGSSKATSQAV